MRNRALIIVNMESVVDSTETYAMKAFGRDEWKKELEAYSSINVVKVKNVGFIKPKKKLDDGSKFKYKIVEIAKRKEIKWVDVVATVDNDAIGKSVTKDQISSAYEEIKSVFNDWCKNKNFNKKLRFRLMLPPKNCAVDYLIDCMFKHSEKGCLSLKDNLNDIAIRLGINGNRNAKNKILSWREHVLDKIYDQMVFESRQEFVINITKNLNNDYLYLQYISGLKEKYSSEICGYYFIFDKD